MSLENREARNACGIFFSSGHLSSSLGGAFGEMKVTVGWPVVPSMHPFAEALKSASDDDLTTLPDR